MTKSRSGFSLLEVLAAILLSGLFISVFAQLFSIARGSDKIPGELFAAVARAQELLARAGRSDPEKNAISNARFRERVEISKLRIIENPDQIAPAVSSPTGPQQGVPGSQQLPSGSPQSTLAAQQAASAPPPQLRAVSIVVIAPSGRRTELDGVASLAP